MTWNSSPLVPTNKARVDIVNWALSFSELEP